MRGGIGFASSSWRIASVARNPISRRQFSCTSPAQATYGFVGLGQMGYRMAKNLREKLPTDDVLIVQDINQAASKKFAEELTGFNVVVAESPRQVAENSETIITALPEPPHVKAVYDTMLQPATLLKGGVPTPRLFIDCSTIDLETSAAVANAARSTQQGSFVDAPMSGGVMGAEAGTLTFMIGAPSELIEKASNVLSLMGRRILHMGDQGAGLKAKLANNYLLALNNIATCEAMSMGIKWGLDPKALADMINISTGRCWPSEVNNPVPGVIPTSPSSKGYAGGFGVSLMNKDLKLALKACEEFGVDVRIGPVAKQIYDAVQADENCKGKDFSVVYRYLGGKE
ncbi:3-hydroxyisobutyrate dehydrogenase mitochondrial precursor [Trichodelitschia bisporula]|uniref:3-hydroxyisobutyrate dehydrogenase n=1 Tax=Trichodelitschia bisporula TaxID=703511 RepID=A0A6G1HKW7_9PEZI|nr:3-hydroxyisobutyrate dehydrogenase mitochondrial precursor [Trichodelitschia bisporula]